MKFKFFFFLFFLYFSFSSAQSICGDGIVNGTEICDTAIHNCCGDDCHSYASSLKVFRNSTGPCDPPENCPGNFHTGLAIDLKLPNGTSCSDGIFCNGDEYCYGGVCQNATSPRNCTSPTICATGICNEDTNSCVFTTNPIIGTPCYEGPNGTLGVGNCQGGIYLCNPNNTFTCIQQVLPKANDTCGNAIDDDCNGVADEGCDGVTCLDDSDCVGFEPSACTTSLCNNSTNLCEYPILPGYCYTGGLCFVDGAIDPINPCRTCQSSINNNFFLPNDTLDPSDGDICNGKEVCYLGNVILNPLPLECPTYTNECSPVICDPILGCQLISLPDESNCNMTYPYDCLDGSSYCLSGMCFCNGTLFDKSIGGEPWPKWKLAAVIIPIVVIGVLIGGVFIHCLTLAAGRKMRKDESVRNGSRMKLNPPRGRNKYN